jgi:aryl-alcohol dehydrogenase-like predicted oxidoreductase
MERRRLGDTDIELSLLGFGGIVLNGLPQAEADRLVAEALARGIDYFDSSPTYGDSEARLGPALAPHRDRVFLACKTNRRRREEAQRKLEESLRALRTDHFDLYQVHEIDTPEEVETVFAPGGAMEAFAAARERGLTRLIGFSSHSAPVALEMLRRYPFDTALFPFTYASWFRGYGPQVMAEATARGVARLGMKAFVRSRWPDGVDRDRQEWWYRPPEDEEEAALLLRFELSLGITACISPGLPRLYQMSLDIAERFTPLTGDEMARVEALARRADPLFPAPGCAGKAAAAPTRRRRGRRER